MPWLQGDKPQEQHKERERGEQCGNFRTGEGEAHERDKHRKRGCVCFAVKAKPVPVAGSSSAHFLAMPSRSK